LSSLGGDRERDRAAVLDEEKRHDALQLLSARLAVIKHGSAGSGGAGTGSVVKEEGSDRGSDKGSERGTERGSVSQSSSYADFTTTHNTITPNTASSEPCPLILTENEFYTLPASHTHTNTNTRTASSVVEDMEYTDNKGLSTLRSVFDGTQRFACEFKVHVPDGDTSGAALPAASKKSKWHTVPLNAADIQDSSAWSADNIIPSGSDTTSVIDEDAPPALYIALESFDPVPEHLPVQLTASTIIPRDQDNSLCRALRTDLHAYHTLTSALTARMSALLQTAQLHTLSNTIPANKQQWDAVDALYTKQQIWKAVASALHRGVRDQAPDFNKGEEEVSCLFMILWSIFALALNY